MKTALPVQGAEQPRGHCRRRPRLQQFSHDRRRIASRSAHNHRSTFARPCSLAEGLSDERRDIRRMPGTAALQVPERSSAQRLRDHACAASVRAAGTSTIRRAREDTDVHGRSRSRAGSSHRSDLRHRGSPADLQRRNAQPAAQRRASGWSLDIGGGSTEVILGQGPDTAMPSRACTWAACR